MTEVTAFPDSGAVQDGDLFWISRAGVAYKVPGELLCRKNEAGNWIFDLPGAASPRWHMSGVSDDPVIEGYRYTGVGSTYYAARFVLGVNGFHLQNAAPAGIGGHGWVSRWLVDGAGHMLVGVAANSGYHQFVKSGSAEGSIIFQIDNSVAASLRLQAVTVELFNSANAAAKLGRDGTTGRSINAGGTINASGADYAEYMTKSEGCGTIAKGDVCGVDAEGKLTKSWAQAITFGIKSTAPNLVGGDIWGSADAVGERPSLPTWRPPLYDGPLEGDDGYDAAIAAHAAAVSVARAEYEAATEVCQLALAQFEAGLEAARQRVDRIAYCGQVPVNFEGDFEAGDYLVAVADGDGIAAQRVTPADMAADVAAGGGLYLRRVGRVLRALEDGRPLVMVQYG